MGECIAPGYVLGQPLVLGCVWLESPELDIRGQTFPRYVGLRWTILRRELGR
ncbi:hypothetical protein ACWEPH_18495 [Nocardia beijingensis]